MHIIAFTDIHGAYKKVNEILSRKRSYDVIVVGGDLTTFGSPKEAEDAIRLFQTHGKPLLVVAGNMDRPGLEQTFNDLNVSINGRGILQGDIGFFGVSASPFSPLHTPYEISEEEIMRRAEKGWSDVREARWKIFVPHAPPTNTRVDKIFTGAHVGSTAVREFIEQRQPDVVVCGHIHEARGKDAIGKTQIVNCGPAGKGYYAVIEIGETVRVENRG
ncbi:MAG: metallophosphoesterase [Ignavibacteriales bacterium]|nr:metallophosphoesterase [Ignavibacteriales bacterium]